MPKNTSADLTKLNYATSTRRSFRTSVPAFISAQYDLEKGDQFKWKILGDDKIEIEIVRGVSSEKRKVPKNVK